MSNYEKYFKNDLSLLEKLEILHYKKQKLVEHLALCENKTTFVAELSGLPRTGKTATTERIYKFFKAGNINVSRTIEPAHLIKEMLSIQQIRQMSNLEFNDKTLEVSKESLTGLKESNPELILMDRGIIDNYFWYQMMLKENKIDIQTYENRLLSLASDLSKIDQLFVLTALPEIVVLRDYINQIYLEDRNKTTVERVTLLQEGFSGLLSVIKKEKDAIVELDTSEMSEIDTAIFITDNIMDGMTKKSRILKKENNLGNLPSVSI